MSEVNDGFVVGVWVAEWFVSGFRIARKGWRDAVRYNENN